MDRPAWQKNVHSLHVIKHACAEALDDDERDPAQFYAAVVDPGSVMKMTAIIETLLMHIEQTGRGEELAEQVKLRIREYVVAGTPKEE